MAEDGELDDEGNENPHRPVQFMVLLFILWRLEVIDFTIEEGQVFLVTLEELLSWLSVDSFLESFILILQFLWLVLRQERP